MIKFFFDAIDCISKKEEVPYFIDTKIRNLHSSLSISESGEILFYILQNNNAGEVFRYFSKNQALQSIFLSLDNLRRVPQNKGKSSNAFEHSIKVLDLVPIDNIDLRWVALFHDLGKYDSYISDQNFNRHQIYSYDMALHFCLLYEIQNREKICSIIKNHMFPLDYQRNPNWTKEAIIRLIDRCGKENVIDTIEFSYYDKQSENNVKEFLDIIIELKSKVQEILNER